MELYIHSHGWFHAVYKTNFACYCKLQTVWTRMDDWAVLLNILIITRFSRNAENIIMWKLNFNAYISDFLFRTPIRTVHMTLRCSPAKSLLSALYSWGIWYVLGRASLIPVVSSPVLRNQLQCHLYKEMTIARQRLHMTVHNINFFLTKFLVFCLGFYQMPTNYSAHCT